MRQPLATGGERFYHQAFGASARPWYVPQALEPLAYYAPLKLFRKQPLRLAKAKSAARLSTSPIASRPFPNLEAVGDFRLAARGNAFRRGGGWVRPWGMPGVFS